MRANFVFVDVFTPEVEAAFVANGLGGAPAISVEVESEAEAQAMLVEMQAEVRSTLRLVMGEMPEPPERAANAPALTIGRDGAFRVGPPGSAPKVDPESMARAVEWGRKVLAEHKATQD